MSKKDQHIKELQNLLAREKATVQLLNAHLARCHDTLQHIMDIAGDAI